MFQPDHATPRRRLAFNNQSQSQSQSPRAPPDYNYSHPGPEVANRAREPIQTSIGNLRRKRSHHDHDIESLPRYEWKTPPHTSAVVPPQTQTITSGNKRQNKNYGTHAVKRQRLDSSPHPSTASPNTWSTNPPCCPDPAEPSRSFLEGLDHFFPNPRFFTQPQVPESSNGLQLFEKDKLSEQMLELFEACQQQSSDLERKEVLRNHLQQEIQQFYAVARLYMTGSSMNGLGCRSSDADLCLVITGNKRPDPISVLSQLKRAFGTLPYIERIQLIRAKVPILRFRERGSDLEFDLNINNTVGIRNTFLLRSYAYADHRIRPLILVIKKWARHHQINDASKGTLSSYTLVLMVLHYLQTLKEPVLPSLQRDYPCFNPFMNIDMVPEGPKHIPPYVSRNQSSLGELLLGFLRYYTTQFSWDKQVISVREAAALPRTNSQQWKNKFICVEEPFERNNVARAVHEKPKFDIIKAQFAESCRKLHARKDLNSILPVKIIINKELSRK